MKCARLMKTGLLDGEVQARPSYVIDGEIFWGQDRLGFVERKLGRA